jgi:hypothetical protein
MVCRYRTKRGVEGYGAVPRYVGSDGSGGAGVEVLPMSGERTCRDGWMLVGERWRRCPGCEVCHGRALGACVACNGTGGLDRFDGETMRWEAAHCGHCGGRGERWYG